MKDINYLYDNLYNSNNFVSVIGYSISNEHLKDEFISRLPHCSIKNINSSFNINQYLRDIKIEQVLHNGVSIDRFLVIDADDVAISKDSNSWAGYSLGIGILISEISLEVRKHISQHVNNSNNYDPPFSLIITSRINKSPNDKFGNNIFLNGGSRLISGCDFAFCLQDDQQPYIKVIKNRNGIENIDKIDISDLIKSFNKKVYKDRNHEYSK